MYYLDFEVRIPRKLNEKPIDQLSRILQGFVGSMQEGWSANSLSCVEARDIADYMIADALANQHITQEEADNLLNKIEFIAS